LVWTILKYLLTYTFSLSVSVMSLASASRSSFSNKALSRFSPVFDSIAEEFGTGSYSIRRLLEERDYELFMKSPGPP
jgi:hypothetical protein